MRFLLIGSILLLASSVGPSLQVSSIEELAQSYATRPYERLDKHLEQAGANNLGDGILAAKEYLSTLRRKAKSLFGKKERRLIRTIERFLGLGVVFAEQVKCDWANYLTVNQFVDKVVRDDLTSEVSSRLARMALEAALKFAQACEKTYAQNYAKLLAASSSQAHKSTWPQFDSVMSELAKIHFGGNPSPPVEKIEELFVRDKQGWRNRWSHRKSFRRLVSS